MIRSSYQPTLGAVVGKDGVRFRVWAPDARSVRLHLRRGQQQRDVPDGRQAAGIWEFVVDDAGPGDRYAYSLDADAAKPDPASRFQPEGVHGWSEIVDPAAYRWRDAEWAGPDPRRTVIYELHVGTFTSEGSYASAATKIPYLRDLGVTAIELMPLADFAGERNWGYDGVALFAPSHAYGRPDDLRAFIDAAHGAGLAVIIDVVYNHLGPEGAYLPAFSSRFLTTKHETPWGGAVNLDDEGGDMVRRFITESALHWIHEYHADGLRLDATHSLFDSRARHFVAELTDAVHAAAKPSPLVYAEDHRNLSTMVEDAAHGGWGLDGVWADDFHHVVRRMLAADAHGYYVDYEGTADELAATLNRGWLFIGQRSQHEGGPRGTDPSRVPMRKAVVCVPNHDQVGNRALGDRLHHTADAAAWRAAITVLLTSPMTPLLFMGQEWATSAPFQFFTDFGAELGALVVTGRRREFRDFPEFATDEGAERIPDPQSPETFAASRLRWQEQREQPHAGVLELHRALLRLRAEHEALHASDRCTCEAAARDDSTVVFRRDGADGPLLIVARLRGSGAVAVPELHGAAFSPILDTEDRQFVADPNPPTIDQSGTVTFRRPGAIVFQR